LIIPLTTYHMGKAVAEWLRCCATNRKVAGSIPTGVIGIFHWYKILPIALWSLGRLSLWQKWVPGAFSRGKGGRCVRLITLPPSPAVVMKSGNLNFLEFSGPLQACNETALPFTYHIARSTVCNPRETHLSARWQYQRWTTLLVPLPCSIQPTPQLYPRSGYSIPCNTVFI